MTKVLLFLLSGLLAGSAAYAQTTDSVAERQQAVERGLLPAVLVAGQPEPSYSIYDRMAHYNVPGVSVAVIHGGHVEWAEGYGTKKAGTTDSVTTSTLFQAASISKPVAATAALRLVEEEQVALDDDVNTALRSWRVPENEYTAEQPVTLRGLLSHTAGLTVSGFPGYAAGVAVPSVVDVLDGKGNTDPVRADTLPGAQFSYSGGGYTVAQLLIEDVTGEPFAVTVEQSVLHPAGMYRSTFRQPLPDRLSDDAAVAHQSDGTPVEGGWHTYPEQAAAGLWTTPTDLARFALAIRASYFGQPGALLKEETVHEMLTVPGGSEGDEGYALGFGINGSGDSLNFGHGGSNRGYRAFLMMYPATGNGVAVMTNAANGGGLMMEVARAVARTYGWSDLAPEVRTVVEVDPATLAQYAGVYRFVGDPEELVVVEQEGEGVYATISDGPRRRLHPESETVFFLEESGTQVTFRPEGEPGTLEVYGERAVLDK
ncbi:MAG: serine hydrolase domain-containing protein [Rhodothermales bacterium]